MTRYDEPNASDGRGGPHPLAGVPQSALDAATDALRDVLFHSDLELDSPDDDNVAVAAHAVLIAYRTNDE